MNPRHRDLENVRKESLLRCNFIFTWFLTFFLLQGMLAHRALAATIYASGQLLVEGEPGTHDDLRENRIYAIDTVTGAATPVSSVVSGTPAALAGTVDERLFGFRNGQIGEVALSSGVFTPNGAPTNLSVTALDITTDGRGFVLPFDANFATQQLHRIDLMTGQVTPIGGATAIGEALETAFGLDPGTAAPFIISLGSAGQTLYGVNLEDERTNLIAIDPDTGTASVLGAPDAVAAANGEGYSGFAALTGVDENGDGEFDALFGNVNFFDNDNDPSTPTIRLGGVARYDLAVGTWSLVGVNPGLIFFGFGSFPAPKPETRLVRLHSNTEAADIQEPQKTGLLKTLTNALRSLALANSQTEAGKIRSARQRLLSTHKRVRHYADTLENLLKQEKISPTLAASLLAAVEELLSQLEVLLIDQSQ